MRSPWTRSPGSGGGGQLSRQEAARFEPGFPGARHLAAPQPLAHMRRLGLWWPHDQPLPAALIASMHQWLRLGGWLAWDGPMAPFQLRMTQLPMGRPTVHRYHFGGRDPGPLQRRSRLTVAGTPWVTGGLRAHLDDPSLWGVLVPQPTDLLLMTAGQPLPPRLRRLVWDLPTAPMLPEETVRTLGLQVAPRDLDAWARLLTEPPASPSAP